MDRMGRSPAWVTGYLASKHLCVPVHHMCRGSGQTRWCPAQAAHGTVEGGAQGTAHSSTTPGPSSSNVQLCCPPSRRSLPSLSIEKRSGINMQTREHHGAAAPARVGSHRQSRVAMLAFLSLLPPPVSPEPSLDTCVKGGMEGRCPLTVGVPCDSILRWGPHIPGGSHSICLARA